LKVALREFRVKEEPRCGTFINLLHYVGKIHPACRPGDSHTVGWKEFFGKIYTEKIVSDTSLV
jgi:hypothetical protein